MAAPSPNLCHSTGGARLSQPCLTPTPTPRHCTQPAPDPSPCRLTPTPTPPHSTPPQVANCFFCLYYWPYLEAQTWPGAFAINVPALFSIICVVISGDMQGKEEAKLIEAQPARFPAPVAKYLKVAYGEWKSGQSGKPLIETLRGALDEFNIEKQSKGGGNNLPLLLYYVFEWQQLTTTNLLRIQVATTPRSLRYTLVTPRQKDQSVSSQEDLFIKKALRRPEVRMQRQSGRGTYSIPLTTHYLLLTTYTYYLLLTTHYLPLTTYHLQLTTHYSLLTTHYSLSTTYYVLPTHYYALLSTDY